MAKEQGKKGDIPDVVFNGSLKGGESVRVEGIEALGRECDEDECASAKSRTAIRRIVNSAAPFPALSWWPPGTPTVCLGDDGIGPTGQGRVSGFYGFAEARSSQLE